VDCALKQRENKEKTKKKQRENKEKTNELVLKALIINFL
jgi:hypothetical protein